MTSKHEKTYSAYCYFSALYKLVNCQLNSNEVDFLGVWLPTSNFEMRHKSNFFNEQNKNIIDTFKKTRTTHCLAYDRRIPNLYSTSMQGPGNSQGQFTCFYIKKFNLNKVH